MAALALGHAAAGLGFEGFAPSVQRELTMASPELYGSMLAWLSGASLLAMGIAVLYELPARLVRRPFGLIAFVTIVTGVLAGGGQPVWLSMLTATLLVAVLVSVYAWNGLAAVAVTVWTCFLLLDLAAAWSVGGPVAGSRGTMLLVTFIALAALAAWAFGGERVKAGAATLSSKSGIR